jgi:hypothetical protein
VARRSAPSGEGHGVNGSTSVSKTESLGSNPSAPATSSSLVPSAITLNDSWQTDAAPFGLGFNRSLLDPDGYWIEPDGIDALSGVVFYRKPAPTGCH